MQRIQSNMSDDRTQMGPASKPQTSDADQPTRMDSKAITTPTTMPGWTFGIGSTQLGAGTRLFEYEVTGVIGQGGFGIVYRALDRVLNRSVAIKEYLPATMALRSDTGGVTLASQAHVNAFEAGLKSFVNEARLLAQFDHPSLVKVYRFWEANGTAYMVMPFYEGVTLKDTCTSIRACRPRVLARVCSSRCSMRSRRCTTPNVLPPRHRARQLS